MLWIDFETRSECDLTAAGVYNYAMHRSTEVLCMCYAFDDGDVLTWTPDQPFPQDVFRYQGPIYAHNATFERLILWYVLQTDHKLEQFVCTAAQARANCAPGSLEDIGRFSGAGMRKDHSGAALIRKCCVPPFRHTADDLAALFAYCAQDVRAMRDVSQRLRPLSATELADYHANERINDRGVLIDVALARAATQYSAEEANDIQNTVWEITTGMVASVRSPVMREWVLDRLTPEQLTLTEVNGKPSIDKSVRANLLACDDLDPDVREVVQCADDIWSSSVAKFARLASLADEEDNRLRGAFVFAGGAATGRAASYGAQVHNLPRRTAKDPVALRQAIVRGHKLDGRVSDALKSMLRPALIPAPRHVFVTADWSAIEGRVNPWLADSEAGEAKLDVYRSGRDPYIVNAATTFGGHYDALAAAVASEDAEAVQRRQVGKVQELSCFSAETKVLTNNGVKAIVDVITDDLLWDGQEWVTHQGVVSKGLRQTINVCGLSVTEDHLFLVKHEWLDAKTVLTSKNILTQALATGSASLPYLDARLLKPARAARVWFRFSALAARRRTQSSYTTFSKVHLRDAASALKNPQGFGEKIFTSTPTPAQTMAIDGVCSIGSPHARTDATIQMIEATQIMAGAASRFMARGKQIKQRFCGMFSLSAGGISRIWNLTESTSIKAMSRAIFGSLPSRKTAPISEKFRTCNDTSSNLRPVFDILNSGLRNRFTILTDRGPLIAHNCGFGGGQGAFAAMARGYGVTVSNPKQIVAGWRKANPWAPVFWSQLEDAYVSAMRHPGEEQTAGRVAYLFDKRHLWYILPSGRVLCYPFAKLTDEGLTYAKASWRPKADATEWPRARLWNGLACENVVQATAHDLLREALRVLDDVVLHVHDEIVLEVPEAEAEAAARRLEDVMQTAPDWAAGLPLVAKAKTLLRFGK